MTTKLELSKYTVMASRPDAVLQTALAAVGHVRPVKADAQSIKRVTASMLLNRRTPHEPSHQFTLRHSPVMRLPVSVPLQRRLECTN